MVACPTTSDEFAASSQRFRKRPFALILRRLKSIWSGSRKADHAVLREHEAGSTAGNLARKHGISEATLYNWKAGYGGMYVADAKRLKALEEENAKLNAFGISGFGPGI